MNTQTNQPKKAAYTFAVVGVGIATLFLTYCLGVGTTIQSQAAANMAKPVETVSKPEVDSNLSLADKADTVYYTCEWSRQQEDGPSERLCGELQDAYGMEYLCKERNALPTNQCWVESPSGDLPESQDI